MAQTFTKEVFCAACQAVKEMSMTLDSNNELLVTCPCGRHLKFPFVTDPDALEEMLLAHHEANKGQVSAEAVAAIQAEKDAAFHKLMGVV